MKVKLVSVLAALCGVGLISSTALADIIVNGTPGQAGGSFVITTDITFTIQTTGTTFLLVLNESVQSDDGVQNLAPFPVGTMVNYKINGASAQASAFTYIDNLANTLGDIGPRDSYFTITIPVTEGDKVTLLAQTLPLDIVTAGFNPDALGTFTGRAFLADIAGTRLSDLISMNRATRYAEIAVGQYNFYAGMGQTNLGLHHFYENISLSLYYFHLDSTGDRANAEFNFYKFKGLSLKHLHMSQGKPRLGRYFQFLNLGLAHKRFWILKGNPRKGQQLFVKYRKIALAARR